MAAGTVQLAGMEEEHIFSMAETLLTDPAAYAAMAHAVNPLWGRSGLPAYRGGHFVSFRSAAGPTGRLWGLSRR